MLNKNKALNKVVSAIPLSSAYSHTVATDPVQQFMFSVTFDNFIVNGTENDKLKGLTIPMGFQKVSGLSVEMNAVEYHEGCSLYPVKLAGKASFPDVTLEKGCIQYSNDNTTAFEFKESGDQKTVTAVTTKVTNVLDLITYIASSSTARFDATISILGRDGSVRVSYILRNAFVSKWEGPDLDASSDDVAIEKITLSYDYWEYTNTGTAGVSKWDPKKVEDTVVVTETSKVTFVSGTGTGTTPSTGTGTVSV